MRLVSALPSRLHLRLHSCRHLAAKARLVETSWHAARRDNLSFDCDKTYLMLGTKTKGFEVYKTKLLRKCFGDWMSEP